MYADQESRSRQQAGSRARIQTLIRSPLLCRRITGLVCTTRPPSSLSLPCPSAVPRCSLAVQPLPSFSSFIPKTSISLSAPLSSPEHCSLR